MPKCFSASLNDELPAAKPQRVAALGGRKAIQSSTPSSQQNLGSSSPDKSLILNTPDAPEGSAFQRNKFVKSESWFLFIWHLLCYQV